MGEQLDEILGLAKGYWHLNLTKSQMRSFKKGKCPFVGKKCTDCDLDKVCLEVSFRDWIERRLRK